MSGDQAQPDATSRKRKRNTGPRFRSIYTTPLQPLNRRLYESHRPTADGEGDEDGHNDAVPNDSASASVLVTRKRQRGDRVEFDGTVTPTLPGDDLIRALHSHSSSFYARNGLLTPPVQQTRAPGGTKKRDMLEEQGALEPTPKRPRRIVVVDLDPDASDTEDNTQGQQHAPAQESTNLPMPRGERKRRDMYRALDGSALLALGVLVEEHVMNELRRVGYCSNDGSS